MAVCVVGIGHMMVHMAQRLMSMLVAVFARWHRVMHMIVVPVIVSVRVFMVHRLVRVRVAMRLGQV